MKLKCRPEDFVVEELAEPSAGGGPYALYRLQKCGLGTPEAIAAVVQRWRIPRRWISFGGLKDRHAVTAQWVTIHGGPRRTLTQEHFSLAYEGQRAAPFTPADIVGNRFRIVARDLSEAEAGRAVEAIHVATREGVPNYYDEQRFGSVGVSGEFVARAWCAEDYQRALWLALAEPHAHDRSAQKAERALLRDRWGDWPRCLADLRRLPMRRILEHLAARPHDFRGAMEQIDAEQRSLYLAAFQSYLWNRMLTAWLRRTLDPALLLPTTVAQHEGVFFCNASPQQQAMLEATLLPLPSARMRHEIEPWAELIESVLTPLGLTVEQLRIKRLRETFFSKGYRAVAFRPKAAFSVVEDDCLHFGRKCLTLGFELPRGAYATLLVRRVTFAAGS